MREITLSSSNVFHIRTRRLTTGFKGNLFITCPSVVTEVAVILPSSQVTAGDCRDVPALRYLKMLSVLRCLTPGIEAKL